METDHQSLEQLLTQRSCTQRLARWLNELSEYRPEFKWIAGTTNTTADGLSRRVDFQPTTGAASCVDLKTFLKGLYDTITLEDTTPTDEDLHFKGYDEAMLVFCTLLDIDLTTECKKYYSTDKHCKTVIASLKRGQDHHLFGNYKLEDDLLWYKGKCHDIYRLCLPYHKGLLDKILFSEHDDPSKGHPGVFKTLHFLKEKYYWKNMEQFTRNYIKTCEKCQRNKIRQSKAPGLLNPLDIPEARWKKITMDFITGLPTSKTGKNAIWVIVDRLTKRAHFTAIKYGDDSSNAKECAQIFIKDYIKLHGLPDSIVSDRDSRFTSKFWQDLMNFFQIRSGLSSAFRPSTDGQSERTNRFLEDYMRNYVNLTQDNWEDLLPMAEVAYNSRIHEAIQMSPYEADLGYIPRNASDIRKQITFKTNEEAYRFGVRQQQTLEKLKIVLKGAQKRMKKYYDHNRPIQILNIGDKVLLNTKNLDIQHTGTAATSSRKFAPIWIGPYTICGKITIDTYRLNLPKGLRLHPEFHTSLLKPYHKDPYDVERLNKPNEAMVAAGGEAGYLVEKFISHRLVNNVPEIRVKWVGYPNTYNSWEPIKSFYKSYMDELITYCREKKLKSDIWLNN